MFGLLRWLIGSKRIAEYEPEEQRRKRVSANERYRLIARRAAEIEARGDVGDLDATRMAAEEIDARYKVAER